MWRISRENSSPEELAQIFFTGINQDETLQQIHDAEKKKVCTTKNIETEETTPEEEDKS